MTRLGLMAAAMCAVFCAAADCGAAQTQTQGSSLMASPWEQPAAALAAQIADLLGPGQARLAIRDQSSVPVDEIPAIRKLLEQDLKTHGVTASGAESANVIRVTLSENARERLWVAEVIQGSETRVAMVRLDAGAPSAAVQAKSGLVLRKDVVIQSETQLVAALEYSGWLVTVEPDKIVLHGKSSDNWREQRRLGIAHKRPLTRDPRGMILPNHDQGENGFEVLVAALHCGGIYGINDPGGQWPASCNDSDDPWPIAQIPATAGAADATQGSTSIKAFYNAARNYFTGVVTPSVGVDLPPFYSAVALPRPAGAALLIGGIDGKVQIAENGALKPVSGTRDWGSDFAVLHSGCGAGDQVIASGSGEAVSDSLRAYELPALEAVAASAPLAMDGTVTALWAAPDGKSVMAVVRHADGEYEVDRVTALCD